MSSSQDSCISMRQSGCLPLLIQLLHGNDKDSVLLSNSWGGKEALARASAALHNIIHSQPDDKRGRREIRVLHLLEQIRAYCETCWEWQEAHEQGMDQDKNPMPAPVEHQICPAVCVLMKLSFDEEHRHAMNELGRKATRGISSQELWQGLSGGSNKLFPRKIRPKGAPDIQNGNNKSPKRKTFQYRPWLR
ncbi:adenomatous polyposis coli protein-like [Muntiacus reevesi]|uniref:adenomatous polyposis coli protein-like n=1 Tax=Muntiacus reevesi TaxID=9886 RepID=UPI003306F180